MSSVGQLLQMSPEYRAAEIAKHSAESRLKLVRLAGYAIDRDMKKVDEYRQLIHDLSRVEDAPC